VSQEFDKQIYQVLFLNQDDDDEPGYRVKPEVMDIILQHFPEGELILSMENVMSSVLICASDIQFYLETHIDEIDPEEANDFVMKVLTTVLGINRVWKFIDSHYEDKGILSEYI
jgi:hypothetical protein